VLPEAIHTPTAWALEARYLAIGIMNAALTVWPERVVPGGCVVKKPGLLPIVRTQVKMLMSGYIELASQGRQHRPLIVPPGLGDHAGVLGALHLAMEARPGLAK
jgi:fructokinase